MIELNLVAIFLAGLLGGVHCIGMCGGIVGILGAQTETSSSEIKHLLIHFAYNFGRIFSYGLAGLIFGFLGKLSVHQLHTLLPIQQILYFITNLLLLLLGLYLANFWQVLRHIEKLGQRLWQKIRPQAQRYLPIRTWPHAFLVGCFWGWIPCGLVYTALVTAFSTASPLWGMLVMLVFGFGTLPNLIAMGFVAQQLLHFVRQPWVKKLAGSIIILFAFVGFMRGFHFF